MATSGDSWTGNPNSRNQRWSRWTFVLEIPLADAPTLEYVRDNARRFFRRLFCSSAGQVQVINIGTRWTINLRIEGPCVIDPGVRLEAKRQFIRHFVERGFRHARLVRMDAALLAGSREDGSPPDQVIVLPLIPLEI